jgi:hypothetical protein
MERPFSAQRSRLAHENERCLHDDGRARRVLADGAAPARRLKREQER